MRFLSFPFFRFCFGIPLLMQFFSSFRFSFAELNSPMPSMPQIIMAMLACRQPRQRPEPGFPIRIVCTSHGRDKPIPASISMTLPSRPNCKGVRCAALAPIAPMKCRVCHQLLDPMSVDANNTFATFPAVSGSMARHRTSRPICVGTPVNGLSCA